MPSGIEVSQILKILNSKALMSALYFPNPKLHYLKTIFLVSYLNMHRQDLPSSQVIKDWSTVIKMGKLLKMETFSRLFPGPGEESGWRLDRDSRCT